MDMKVLHLYYRTDNSRVIRGEVDGLVGELGREVGEVPLALQPGSVGGRDLLLLEQRPVDRLEEGVSHDLHKPGLAVTAESVCGVLVQESWKQNKMRNEMNQIVHN